MRRVAFIAPLAVFFFIALLPFDVCAQQMPERSLVRRGNRSYDREKYEKSVDLYNRALEADPANFEAKYDLASALFRTERYDKAEQTLKSIAPDSTRSEIDRADAAYNLGNTQFAQQKYKEALASYREAMRLNPADTAAKYNYAYTKLLLQQQQQQQQQQNDQNNQEQQDKQDGQNDQNKQQNQDQQNDQQQPSDGDEQKKDGSEQSAPREGEISPQEQQAMLDAIQAQEDKTQEKLKEKVRGMLIRGAKNW